MSAQTPVLDHTFRKPCIILGGALGGFLSWGAICSTPQIYKLTAGKRHLIILPAMALGALALAGPNWNRVPTKTAPVKDTPEEK